jgi:hypothetical protein
VTFQWFAARKSFPPLRAAHQLLPGARERRRRRSAAPSLADDPSPTGSPCGSGGDIADFSFASSDFQNLRRLFLHFCNFVILAESRTVSRRPLTTSCGFAASKPLPFPGAIQSFQPVAAPFPGDSVLPSGPLAPRFRRPKRLCSKTDNRPGDLRRDGAVRTNIERLRNSGKNFVERHDQGHGMFLIASVVASRFSAKRSSEASSDEHCRMGQFRQATSNKYPLRLVERHFLSAAVTGQKQCGVATEPRSA